MHGAVPILPQYALMACCSVKAQQQFYLYIKNAYGKVGYNNIAFI
jgi:hypothetical protein